jgi:hypothetical protein
MDRQTIEDKDRDIVKKFRSVVEGKERLKKLKKSRLKQIAGLAIVCGAAFMLFLDHSPRQKPNTGIHQEITAKDSLKDNHETAALPLSENGLQKSIPVDSDPVKSSTNHSGEKVVHMDVRVAVKRPQFSKNASDFQNVKIVMMDNKKITPKSSQKKVITDGVKISNIIACRDVADKRCTSSQDEFSVKRDGQVRVWMDVRSKQLPHILKHLYFVNGRRYRTIPLSIKYPQMRTWSGISLNGSQDVGKWRVDVVSEQGQTLSNIEFKVVP